MTNSNCIVPVNLLQEIDSLAIALIALGGCYSLPEPLEALFEELSDKAESLKTHGLLNQVQLTPVLTRILPR